MSVDLLGFLRITSAAVIPQMVPESSIGVFGGFFELFQKCGADDRVGFYELELLVYQIATVCDNGLDYEEFAHIMHKSAVVYEVFELSLAV